MASLIRSILRLFLHPEPPLQPSRQPPAIADDVLVDIFLRLSSPADLARASAACLTFHRLITDPSFLRRYRSRYPPLLLGFLSASGETSFRLKPAAKAPHPSAAAARALGRAADFSFNDYLPRGRGPHWYLRDVRDGRVLLGCYHGSLLPDLAVCDPLSRRYLLLPPVPDIVQKFNPWDFEASLVPYGDEDDETTFRVIAKILWGKLSVVLVFCSVSGCWIPGAFADLYALKLWGSFHLPRPQYVYGCFYWRLDCINKLLKLDMSRMEFSTVDLPPGHYGGKGGRGVVIVEAGEGRLGMFSHKMHDTSLSYSIRQTEGEGGNEWDIVKTIHLPFYLVESIGTPERYMFLFGTPKVRDTLNAEWFSLEIKTLKQKMMGLSDSEIHPYFGFPPFLSPIRI